MTPDITLAMVKAASSELAASGRCPACGTKQGADGRCGNRSCSFRSRTVPKTEVGSEAGEARTWTKFALTIVNGLAEELAATGHCPSCRQKRDRDGRCVNQECFFRAVGVNA